MSYQTETLSIQECPEYPAIARVGEFHLRTLRTDVASLREAGRGFVRGEIIWPLGEGEPYKLEMENVLVRHLPFGNTLTAQQHLQSRCIFEGSRSPSRPEVMVSLPAPALGSGYNARLQPGEDMMASYARQAHRSIAWALGGLQRMGLLGFSSGATMALAHAREALQRGDAVEWVMAAEPQNIARRGRLRLMRAMSKAGTRELFATIQRTGLQRRFMQAYGVSVSEDATDEEQFREFNRQVRKYVTASFLEDWQQQMRFAGALGRPTLATQLESLVRAEVPILLAHAEQSAMCPQKELGSQLHTLAKRVGMAAAAQFVKVVTVRGEGANHTIGDHVQVAATLVHRAREHAYKARG